MQRVLAITLVCAGIAWPAEAKQLRTTGNELFCLKGEDLMLFVAARTAKEFKDREIAGCMACAGACAIPCWMAMEPA